MSQIKLYMQYKFTRSVQETAAFPGYCCSILFD